MKYSVHDQAILVDGQPVARIEVLPGELDDARLTDLMSAANRGTGRQGPAPGPGPAPTPAQAIPGLVNDIDEIGAGGFLAAHHVPIIGPDMGIELIKVVKRLEVVHGVYPLPPTVEVYRLALHLVLQVAAEHQRAFCAKLEERLVNRIEDTPAGRAGGRRWIWSNWTEVLLSGCDRCRLKSYIAFPFLLFLPSTCHTPPGRLGLRRIRPPPGRRQTGSGHRQPGPPGTAVVRFFLS
jgi:hypothetical protein